jgi:hypothetical protein
MLESSMGGLIFYATQILEGSTLDVLMLKAVVRDPQPEVLELMVHFLFVECCPFKSSSSYFILFWL